MLARIILEILKKLGLILILRITTINNATISRPRRAEWREVMTEEEREKLVNDMEIAILKEGVGTILHSSQLLRMARAALAVAEEAISKDSRARIAELEAALKELREAARGVDQDEMHYSQRDEWGHCLAKADEALKGEKKNG